MNFKKVDSLYWIGTRESEIYHTGDFFKGSITIFGSNKNNNYAFDKTYSWRFNYNLDNLELVKFINITASKILVEDPNAKFMFYFPEEMNEYCEKIKKNTVCQNAFELLNLLEDKIYCKLWLGKSVNLLPFITMTGKELFNSNLSSIFEGYDEFVIQSAFSCGGFGTRLYSINDECINKNTLYMVTPYIKENIPINVHVIVYDEEILYMPPSVQIISLTDNMFLYRGADFVAYERISSETKCAVHDQVEVIAKKLQHCGYRGVCGIDLLYNFTDNCVYYSEINARFQSSTFILNKVLEINDVSIQNLHYEAFCRKNCSYKAKLDICVPYSFYGYQYKQKLDKQLKFVHSAFIKNNFEVYDDELNWEYRLEDYTYLFKTVFHQSIVSWEPNRKIRVPENITINYIDFCNMEDKEYFTWLKIALLNQGVSILPDALNYIESHNKINYKEFGAVDIKLANNLYINAPFQNRLSEISPFTIEMFSRYTYGLCYYGSKLIEISLRAEDSLSSKQTANGVPYENIAYLGNDRLRIYHRSGCYFKSINRGCCFCDIDNLECAFNMEDIKEVLDAYQNCSQIKHFLIGGGSEIPSSNFSSIIEISTYINRVYKKPIYLMSLPPASLDILKQLYAAGITEVAFNIEIYNRTLATKYMPGKGKLSIKQYFTTLEHAVQIWGNHGAVRSIFIIGLEPQESLLEGIEEVCKRGISPILSLFKPIAGTTLEYIVPFTNAEVKKIYDQILKICEKYNVELGPQCPCCEDNTLKITLR